MKFDAKCSAIFILSSKVHDQVCDPYEQVCDLFPLNYILQHNFYAKTQTSEHLDTVREPAFGYVLVDIPVYFSCLSSNMIFMFILCLDCLVILYVFN